MNKPKKINMQTGKSRFVNFTLSLLFLLSIGLTAHAQVGGAAVVFLQIEPDARAAGMGNTGVALADNAGAIFWNPAGLAGQTGSEYSLTHSTWLPEFNADLFYEYLIARYEVPGLGTFGGHVTYLNLGEHEGRDENNISTGTFKSYDLAVGLSYGKQLTSNFAIGTGLRFIYSNLASGQNVGGQATNPGVSVGFDLAGLYKTNTLNLGDLTGQLALGFNLANMGPTIQYSDNAQADPIPTNLRFGWAFTLNIDDYNKLTLTNDFNKTLIHVENDSTNGTRVVDPFYKALFSGWKTIEINTGSTDNPVTEKLSAVDQLTLSVGAEYWYNDLFAIRSGYFYENPYNGNRQFLTFGAGIRYNIVGVDFSYIFAIKEDSPLANTMRFSLIVNMGK